MLFTAIAIAIAIERARVDERRGSILA